MKNQWFRMYSEFLSDPKVQMMNESYQRRLVMLFCMKCNGDETFHDDAIAFQLRIGCVEWSETKAEFIKRGFIDNDNNILNWGKRQYQSDSSTNRVRKHRETVMKRQCNVSVTPPDTEQIQNRTDKKVSKQIPPAGVYSPEFDSLWKIYPRRDGSKQEAFKSYKAAIKRGVSHERIESGVREYANYVARERKDQEHIAHATTWINQSRWESDYASTGNRQAGKPTWKSESERLKAKYRAEAERQGAIDGNGQPALCAPEAIREDPGGIGNAGRGVLLGAI